MLSSTSGSSRHSPAPAIRLCGISGWTGDCLTRMPVTTDIYARRSSTLERLHQSYLLLDNDNAVYFTPATSNSRIGKYRTVVE